MIIDNSQSMAMLSITIQVYHVIYNDQVLLLTHLHCHSRHPIIDGDKIYAIFNAIKIHIFMSSMIAIIYIIITHNLKKQHRESIKNISEFKLIYHFQKIIII